MLEYSEQDQVLLTHLLVPAGPIPTAQDPEGVYPYESYCETSRRPILRSYRMVSLENDLLRVTICPDLGGKVCSLYLKKPHLETLYNPRVIRPVRILPRHFYVGGGIELSFPISHTPVQIVPVRYLVDRKDDRVYIWCGERELRFGMHWTVEYSLGEGDAFLTQRTVFYNPDSQSHPWMSWSNAAVPARPDTEFHFPGGRVLRHDHETKMIDWSAEGPRCQSEVDRMVGFFWREPDGYAFGAFTPSLGAGLYHIADPALTPGIKLWTDGVGAHKDWVTQYTLNGEQCLEIQAGPLVDQSLKDHLQPGQQRHHVEYWIPSDQALDIRQLSLPQVSLMGLEEVPRFDWARLEEVSLWQELVKAFDRRQADQVPSPPGLDQNSWAISGLARVGRCPALGSLVSEGETRDRWLFQLGSWLAGRDEIDPALEVLEQSCDDRARALAGRLWRRNKRQARRAVECFRAIKSEEVALHVQVVIERDLALALLGPEGFEERERWLQAVSALEDEWLIERRASLLVDQGRWEEARQLLEKTPFQLVHQRYARTRLWKQILKHLALNPKIPPNWLGEDNLAEFGAYREYGEDEVPDTTA